LLQQTKIQLEKDFNILQSQNDVRNQNFLLSNINAEMQQMFNNIKISAKDKKQLVDSFNNIISRYQTIQQTKRHY
jgi:hypothetical protein